MQSIIRRMGWKEYLTQLHNAGDDAYIGMHTLLKIACLNSGGAFATYIFGRKSNNWYIIRQISGGNVAWPLKTYL